MDRGRHHSELRGRSRWRDPARYRGVLQRAGPMTWLAGGALLIFLTFMRFGLAELAWIAFAPFLIVLHARPTVRQHLGVWLALTIGWLAAIAKMATAEISWVPVPLFAIP